jgi:uncharacterized protein YoxC
MSTSFEEQPATKRDVAEVKKELTQGLDRVELKVDGLTSRVDGLTSRVSGLEEKMKDGFEGIERLLGGPGGLIPRVKRLEEAVEIRPD